MKDWGITIGARIKSRREEVHMPVSALGRAVGLAPSTVYDLMRSESVSSTKLHLFARALGLNVFWLETGKGPRLASDPKDTVKEPAPADRTAITAEEAQIGRDWGSLNQPQRSVVAAQIRLLLAAQKREESRRKHRGSAANPAAPE
jgi:transcriptional regulator with XRE-family HTH domain